MITRYDELYNPRTDDYDVMEDPEGAYILYEDLISLINKKGSITIEDLVNND